jgi:peptide/nickel transport system substrate-binding protein
VNRGFLVVGLLFAAALLGACDRQPARNIIVIGTPNNVGVLLPVSETSAFDNEINSHLYAALNSARWGDGGIEYFLGDHSLAERWEFGPDSMTLTYHLRSGAMWSDGHPIDAGDVVFTFELVRKPEISSVYASVWAQLDSVVAVDDSRVTFYFKRRYPQMIFDTGIGIIPAHVFEEAASDAQTLTSHPAVADPAGLVVSGPYRVAEWRPGERLLLETNPSSFAPEPATDSIIFRVIQDAVTMLAELETGGLDVAAPIPMSDAARLEADERFRIETMTQRFYDYLAWNLSDEELFGDPDIRHALSLAIDRQMILDGLGISLFTQPAAGPLAPIFADLVDPSSTPDPYLPDSAAAIFTAKGWSDSDGDGVIDKNGRAFSFTLMTQAGNDRRTSAAEIIQARFADIGIQMNVRAMEFNTMLGLMFEGRDFEAVLAGWQVALEPSYLAAFFWPQDGMLNFTGFANAAVDSLIPLAQAAPTAEAAAPYWREVARIIADDRPYAFLWYFDDTAAVSEQVKNTRIDTFGLYQNIYEWVIE